MPVKIFAELQHLKVAENIYFNIADIEITNDYLKLQKDLLTEINLCQTIGKYKVRALFNPSASFGFYSGKFSDEVFGNFKNYLDFVNDSIRQFINFLWFAKDCSSSLLSLIGYVQETRPYSLIIENRRINYGINISETSSLFNGSEIGLAHNVFLKYSEIIKDNMAEPAKKLLASIDPKKPFINIPFNNYGSRIERAIRFLFIARETDFIALKIALYIPILEALFSEQNKDKKEDIAEGSAVFINETKQSQSYQTIISAYQIRSKLLHGDRLPNLGSTRELQLVLLKKIDSVTRKVLTKAIMEESQRFIEKSTS